MFPVLMTANLVLPALGLFGLVLWVHIRRAAPFQAMEAALTGRVMTLSRGSTDPEFYLALVAAVILGLVLLGGLWGVKSWLGLQRKGAASALSLLGLLAGVLPVAILTSGLLWRSLSQRSAFGAVAGANFSERQASLSTALDSIPSLLPFALAALGVLIPVGVLLLVRVFSSQGPRVRPGPWSVLASLLFFLLGLAAFVATRSHAADAEASTGLIKRLKPSREVIFSQQGISLPELKNVGVLEAAPLLLVGDGRVVLEGRMIARLGQFTEEDAGELRKNLSKLKMQFAQLHPGREFQGQLILQCDKRVPAPAVARLLNHCASAGFRKILIASTGRLRVDSRVLYAYVRNRPQALPFQFVDADADDAFALPTEGTFGDWAKALDAAAAKGPVRVVIAETPDAETGAVKEASPDSK